jgi:lipopolysaccharide export system permease protein
LAATSARASSAASPIALVAVLAAILLIDMVEQMRTVGTRTEMTLLEALRLTLLKTPMLVEQTLPFVVLAGTMMAIIGLNRSSELVAMRAAGVSAWRFLTPAGSLGSCLASSPSRRSIHWVRGSIREFESGREDALTDRLPTAGENGVWIRQGDPDGQVVIHADGVDPSGTRLAGRDLHVLRSALTRSASHAASALSRQS